jgi:hypothetical protein
MLFHERRLGLDIADAESGLRPRHFTPQDRRHR